MNLENVQDIYPLTPAQEVMLLHALRDEPADVLFDQLEMTLEGDIETDALAWGWGELIKRHTALRTAFFWQGMNKPVQVIRGEVEPQIWFEDWSDGQAHAVGDAWRKLLAEDHEKRFDLNTAPLLRLTVARCPQRQWRVLVSYHHLIVDGWSLAIMIRQWLTLYAMKTSGADVELPPAGRFRDYVVHLQKRDAQADRAYWSKALGGLDLPTPVPANRQEATFQQEDHYITCRRTLDPPTVGRIEAAARRMRVSTAALVQGAWALLISAYAKKSSVCYGLTVSCRPDEIDEAAHMVGNMINTVPAAAAIDPKARLGEWLARAQADAAERQDHHVTPLAQIMQWSDAADGREPFHSVVLFQNFPVEGTFWDQRTDLRVLEVSNRVRSGAMYTLLVMLRGAMELQLIYDERFVDHATAEAMLDDYRAVVERAADAGDPTVGGVIEGIRLPRGSFLVDAPVVRAEAADQIEAPVEPRNALEQELAKMWAAMLRVDRVGVDTSFFELGGTSLMAMRLIGRIAERYRVPAKIGWLFDEPTIAALARRIGEHRPAETEAERRRRLEQMVANMSPDQVEALLARQREGNPS